MERSDNVMNSLMNALYTVLTDGEEGFVERNAQERFICWCLPGIPLDPEELIFLERGFLGRGNTPEEKAADTALLIGQASRFARLVDFVPETTGIFNGEQQLVAFHRNESALSRIYERTLKQSQVARSELTDETKERIERFRNRLYPEVDVEDIFTGEVKKQRVEGPVLTRYKAFESAWENEFLDYNDKRIRSLVAASQQDVLSFSLNGPALKRKVVRAAGEWDVGGHRKEVEKMFAFIDQVGQRDLTLWKADVLNRFESSVLVDSIGQDFLYTSMVPVRFASSNQGWPTFTFSDKEVAKHSQSKSTQFAAKGKLGWGRWSLGGSGETATEKKHEVTDTTNFEMSFSVTQIPLVRAWFDPTFLESRAWRLNPDAFEVSELSDGGIPPKGMLPAYPTSVIFVRDVRINFHEMHEETSELHKQLKAKVSGGYGPISIGGSYTRDEQTKDFEYEFSERGVTVKGLQIIGFRCHLINKSPDPLSSIEEFV